jgi:peroxiredoxin
VPAPDFDFTTFEGERLGLADFEGQAVVLNFWATWCTPCRTEIPYLEKTYRAFAERGVVFVGLAVQDDPIAAELFLTELGITYPAGPDERGAVGKAHQVRGPPTTVFITRDRVIARKWTGALPEQQLVAFVEEIAG